MNRYIEHIINDLVRDTRIDKRMDRIYFPFLFYPLPPSKILILTTSPTSSRSILLHFSDYCKENYGLTKEEIDYVWDQYKSIIKDKITKRES
jgi:hypothetical protein